MADPESGGASPQGVILLAKANNHLAAHLHRLLSEDTGNVFFSPFSISSAMAMLTCGAEGATESELRTVLGYDHAGLTDAASAFQDQLSSILKSSDQYTLCCGNALLTQKDFDITDRYKLTLSNSFDATVMEIDFLRQSKEAVSYVNDWVKEKTNNMIPKLLDSLDPATVIILLNAVYFKGSWLHKFDKGVTSLCKFYNRGLRESSNEVDMMHLKQTFPHAEEETHQVLELPYAGDDLAMMIFLPNELDRLDKLESSLTPSFIQDARKVLRKKVVKVSLPRFRLEYSKSLNKCFQQLGVARIFSSEAELSNVCSSTNLQVSEIFHKAVLEVNEEGSEAAAVTMVKMKRCAKPRIPEFIVDHPFLFVIYDKRNDLILFMGRVVEL